MTQLAEVLQQLVPLIKTLLVMYGIWSAVVILGGIAVFALMLRWMRDANRESNELRFRTTRRR